eukprot:350311-Pleurochrysis_carterae.AAC.2
MDASYYIKNKCAPAIAECHATLANPVPAVPGGRNFHFITTCSSLSIRAAESPPLTLFRGRSA